MLGLLTQQDELTIDDLPPELLEQLQLDGAATSEAASNIVIPTIEWSAIAPSLILMIGGLLLLTVMSLIKGRVPAWFSTVWTLGVSAASLIATVPLWNRIQDTGAETVMAGALGLDGFSLFVSGIIVLSVILGTLLLDGYVRREQLVMPEWNVLLMLSASGGIVMAAANDLIVMFIGLEILSLAVYVLTAMHARRISSQEAALKYFIMGAFASGFLLYGIALVYGATGTTNLVGIQTFLSDNVLLQNGLLLAGFALLLVGFAFKIGAVPLHMWVPDVYQGAPSPITAFMASGVKVAGFAALIRFFVVTVGPTYAPDWQPIIFVLAILTMVVGALMALTQKNVKRMLAYSSINHAGFILVAVQTSSDAGNSATLFYLLAYTLMVAGSFGIVTIVGRKGDGLHTLEDYKGLGRTRPGIALVFSIFLFAQAGVPFTAGFLAKFYVVTAAVESGSYVLAVLAMVIAVIAAYLYLRIVVAMYFDGNEYNGETASLAGPKVRIPVGAGIALAVAVVGTLWLGIIPGAVTDLTGDAIAQLVALGG